jgi:hypothetical protein
LANGSARNSSDGRFLCFRQPKYAVEGVTLDRGDFKVLAWVTVIALGLRFLDQNRRVCFF